MPYRTQIAKSKATLRELHKERCSEGERSYYVLMQAIELAEKRLSYWERAQKERDGINAANN